MWNITETLTPKTENHIQVLTEMNVWDGIESKYHLTDQTTPVS